MRTLNRILIDGTGVLLEIRYLRTKGMMPLNVFIILGKANTLALILQSDFGEDTKEERDSMRKIKDYLQHEVLEKLYTGIDCGIGG